MAKLAPRYEYRIRINGRRLDPAYATHPVDRHGSPKKSLALARFNELCRTDPRTVELVRLSTGQTTGTVIASNAADWNVG